MMNEPMMNEGQRAQQLWSLLMLAAKTQQILSYRMVEDMTGRDKRGLGEPLGSIYYYCKRHGWPLLNLLVVSQETGKPTPPVFEDKDIPAEQARVFVFDWFSRDVPSPKELEEARKTAEAAKAA